MNRRTLFTAGLAGAAGLLGLKVPSLVKGTPEALAAGGKGGGCTPPPFDTFFTRQLTCLQPNAELEIFNDEGEAIVFQVGNQGTLAVQARSSLSLFGLWEVSWPTGTLVDRSAEGTFQSLYEDFLNAGSIALGMWIYRRPYDIPGTWLRESLGGPMVWRVDSGQDTVPDLQVDLVEFQATIVSTPDLVTLAQSAPPPPPVLRTICSVVLPGGSGLRDIPVIDPISGQPDRITVPGNARLIGIIRRTPLVGVSCRVTLRHSGVGGLTFVPAS